jgi:phosphopantetheine adenylyltransferase
MLSGEAANTNFIVFGLTGDEHANHYTNDAVRKYQRRIYFNLSL